MADLHALMERLRRGEMPALELNEVDDLVAWICGKTNRHRGSGPGSSENSLPSPGHDPVLLQMVFYRLDATLFHGSELNLTAAGLDSRQPEKLRKVRFRRLAGAFHPDRYPELADWLTVRSQIVLQAYGRFKYERAETAAEDRVPPWEDAHDASSDMRPRGRPRKSKRRLRELMLRLRQRFGHDRYLAHKLVGGLAVIALLPVLNLLLVPGKGTVESNTGGDMDMGAIAARDLSAPEAPPTGESTTETERSRSDTAPTASSGIAKATGAEAVAGRDRSAPDTPPTAQPNAKSGESKLATVAENDSLSEPDITPLLAAARRAMNHNGHPTPVATLPSVDEQLAAMGLESDTERLYRRMGDPAAVAGGGEEATVDGGEAPVDGERFTVDGEKRERAERVAGVVGASRAGEGDASRERTVSVFRFPFSGEKAGVAAGGGGNGGSGGSDYGAEAETAAAARIGGESVGAVSGRDRSAQDAPPTGESAAGAERSRSDTAPTAASGTGQATGVGAISNRDRSAPETPTAEPDAESGKSDLATVAENGKRKTENAGDDRRLETHIATAEAETTNPESPARKPSTVNRQPTREAPPALEPGKLALGPMASSAPGKLLAGLKQDMEKGNLAGVINLFSRRASHGELSGLDEIAAHYRALFDRLDPRQVDLSARRIGRDGEGWRVEAVMTIRGYLRGRRGQTLETVLDQRVVMQLDERDGRLKIARLAP